MAVNPAFDPNAFRSGPKLQQGLLGGFRNQPPVDFNQQAMSLAGPVPQGMGDIPGRRGLLGEQIGDRFNQYWDEQSGGVVFPQGGPQPTGNPGIIDIIRNWEQQMGDRFTPMGGDNAFYGSQAMINPGSMPGNDIMSQLKAFNRGGLI